MTDMPKIGEYKGVQLHAFQTAERIETIVKPAIDHVSALTDPSELWEYIRKRSFLRTCAVERGDGMRCPP